MRLANTRLLRLDRLHGSAGGNKYYKLKYNLSDLQPGQRVLSFGGAWSNHLHALAATANKAGIASVGVVRGKRPSVLSATLVDCERWGMHLHFVSRAEYRLRFEPAYQAQLQMQFEPCRVIPEGGASEAGIAGCAEIVELLPEPLVAGETIALACGTGATLAGISRSVPAGVTVLGVAVLKNDVGLRADIASWTSRDNWQLETDSHCGGYVRVTKELKQFVLEFEAVQGIPLDPVYTGKLMLALYKLQESGSLSANQPVVAVHTGGLQGRRGFDWLASHFDEGV